MYCENCIYLSTQLIEENIEIIHSTLIALEGLSEIVKVQTNYKISRLKNQEHGTKRDIYLFIEFSMTT